MILCYTVIENKRKMCMIYKSILLILGYLYGTMLTATFVVKHSTGNDVSKIGSGIPGWQMSWNISGKRKVFWY